MSSGFRIRFATFHETQGTSSCLTQEFIDSWEREKAYLDTQVLPPASYLAISGGSDNGAFTAGFLQGWTQAGTRPQFKLVTGVSTGALIAPFAFLGSAHDETLKSLYTKVSHKDIATERSFYSMLFGDAMADTTPLWKLLKAHVTQTVVDAIGAEYAKGRLLLLSTTDLDARRPVVWNVTKIAASHQPGALELIQKIMLASASIPGAFPPVMINVEANGEKFEEMHVDGGPRHKCSHIGRASNSRRYPRNAGHNASDKSTYFATPAWIRNGPKWNAEPCLSLLAPSPRLVEYQVIGDLNRIYDVTERDGTDFNLAYIPESFKVPHTKRFDTVYMRQLFDFGFQQAASRVQMGKGPAGARG